MVIYGSFDSRLVLNWQKASSRAQIHDIGSGSTFTPQIGPLSLNANNNNGEIYKAHHLTEHNCNESHVPKSCNKKPSIIQKLYNTFTRVLFKRWSFTWKKGPTNKFNYDK
jgi:hypothetical protein